MKRNIIKTILTILLVSIIFSMFINNISQASFDSVDVSYIASDAKDDSGAGKSILKIIQSILVIVQVVAMGVAVIMLIVLAIKYMGSAPSEKATIKNSAIQYIVGAVILFSVAGILGIIRKFSGNIK